MLRTMEYSVIIIGLKDSNLMKERKVSVELGGTLMKTYCIKKVQQLLTLTFWFPVS